MSNKKILQEIKKNLNKAKAPVKKADIDYVSKMGYRDDSPFNKRKSITIDTKDGSIDMSNTGRPLLANGKYLPPYSGVHQFNTNKVTEVPLDEAKKGGSKKYSKSLLAKNRLFAKNPLFKKKNYKNKIYDPSAMYFQGGGATEYNQLPNNYKDALKNFVAPKIINLPEETDTERYGYDAALGVIYQNPNDPIQNVNNPWWGEHELFHHLQNQAGAMSTYGTVGLRPNPYLASDEAIGSYYDRRGAEFDIELNKIFAQNPGISEEEAYAMAEENLYRNPTSVEGEARNYEGYIEAGNPSMFNKKANGGEAACPKGFYNDPVKGCVPIEDPNKFYENWFQNRVMPTPEGQKLLEKIRPEALERSRESVPYIFNESLGPNEAGYYDVDTRQIMLNKFLPEAQIQATKYHERMHDIQAGDKFGNILEKPQGYLVEQNIIEPKAINTGNPEWDKNLKKNYEDIVDPNEIHARVMTLRRLAGFRPDQTISEKDLQDYFKAVKDSGDKLDPDIEDLKGVTKGNKSIVNLLNDMVSVPGQTEDIPYLQPGGELSSDVSVSYLPNGERSYYNPLIDTVYLDPNASKEEFNHEMAHAWQNRNDGFRSDPYSPKLRPSTPASDEQAATYFNRKGDDVDRYINNLKTIVPELGGHTWNADLDRFIPDQLKYDKVIDPLMYSDPSTLEGEAEYMSQVYGRPPLGIKKDGGEKEAMNAMMKARLAYANMFGNPSAQRMINIPDQPYEFNNGDTGTHYMASMDNYAVPQIQSVNGVLQIGDYGPESNEAIRFDSDEDANYFAEHYKDVSPGFMDLELTEDEIKKHVDGGYVVEEINNYKKGGTLLTKKVICKKCGWTWDAADGGNDLTTCHKCGGQGLIHAQKGGYINDISIPQLTRMQLAGQVPDSTYTPIDPNFLAENPDVYSQIVNKPEVVSERQGSDIGKLRAEYREKNPLDIFLDEKKRQFLKKNKVLNKAAGNTMEKFPEDVLQNFINEYNYKTNNYAVNKLGKKEGWNPKRRGEWVDELTPGERDAVAESKYGSKLQPSYWSRSLSGVQELGNTLLPGQPFQYNIPGLTKKEQKEMRDSNLSALETLAPIDIPGAAIANLVKNTGLSTGSNYKDMPGVLSGDKMSNVSDMEAMAFNPLTYAGLEAIPELGVNLVKGVKALPGAIQASKESGLLSNAYKLNPKALKEKDMDFLWRWHADQNPEFLSLAGDYVAPADEYTGRWFKLGKPSDIQSYLKMRPGSGTLKGIALRKGVATLPEDAAMFTGSEELKNVERILPQEYLNETTNFRIERNPWENQNYRVEDFGDRLDEAREILRNASIKPDWLRGYKEVPKELPVSPNTSISDKLKQFFDRPPGPLMIGLGSGSNFTRKVPYPDYYLDIMKLNKYNSKQKKYFEDLIESVKSQGNVATEKQYDELQRIKTGNMNYGKKGYSLNASEILKLPEEEILNKTGRSKEDWEIYLNHEAANKDGKYTSLLEEQFNSAYTPTEQNLQSIEQGKQNLLDFYNSPEYTKRLQNSGMNLDFMEAYNYQNNLINAVNKTKPRFVKSRNAGSLESDAMAYTKGEDPQGTKLGIDFSKRGLERPDAQYLVSHEYGHTSLYDSKNQKLLENLPKLELDSQTLKLWESEAAKEGGQSYRDLINYYSSPDEARQRGLNAILYSKNKGISTDEFVDMPYNTIVNLNRAGEIPTDLMELRQLYSQKDLKDYLKKLYTIVGVTLTTGAASQIPQNKKGGIVSNLTKKEIDKLIKQGYIIEEID